MASYSLTHAGRQRVANGGAVSDTIEYAAWMIAWVCTCGDGKTADDFIYHGHETLTFPLQSNRTIKAAHWLIDRVDSAIAEAERLGWIELMH